MSRKHLMATNRVIAAAGLGKMPEYAAVCQLAQDLARRLQDDSPVTLVSEYRRAQHDLNAAAKEVARRKGARNVVKLDLGELNRETFGEIARDIERRSVAGEFAGWTPEQIAAESGIPLPPEDERGLGWLGRRPDGLALFRAMRAVRSAAARQGLRADEEHVEARVDHR